MATIRPITPPDHPHWLRMRRALWPECSDEMHAFEMNQIASGGDNDAVFVADSHDGHCIGFIEVSVRDRVDGSMSDRVGYIEGWYVEEPERGKGIGRSLVRRAEEWTRERGLTEIASDAELANEGSIRAHHALGFRETFRVVQFVKRV